MQNAAGERVPPQEIGALIAQESQVPSLSIIDIGLYRGAMAAISVQPEGLGWALGAMIPPALVPGTNLPAPQVFDQGQIMININQTNRIGVKVPIEILEYAKVIK